MLFKVFKHIWHVMGEYSLQRVYAYIQDVLCCRDFYNVYILGMLCVSEFSMLMPIRLRAKRWVDFHGEDDFVKKR